MQLLSINVANSCKDNAFKDFPKTCTCRRTVVIKNEMTDLGRYLIWKYFTHSKPLSDCGNIFSDFHSKNICDHHCQTAETASVIYAQTTYAINIVWLWQHLQWFTLKDIGDHDCPTVATSSWFTLKNIGDHHCQTVATSTVIYTQGTYTIIKGINCYSHKNILQICTNHDQKEPRWWLQTPPLLVQKKVVRFLQTSLWFLIFQSCNYKKKW